MSFSLNILMDLQEIWRYQFMQNAIEAGTLTAIVAGVTGYFVVLRKSAFTAHAFSEIGFAGAAWAVLTGIPPLAGLLIGSNLGGLGIALLGRRAINRDTQIGIVLAFSLGLGLLFISLYSGYATQTYSILFGEILGVSQEQVLETMAAAAAILLVLGVVYRPLLFASLDEDVAEAKGMPMLALGIVFMVIVAVAVSFAVEVTGVLLVFSLMVTPGATAQYIARKPATAIAASVIIALLATWTGLFLSFYTSPPVSFYITGEVFAFYLFVRFVYARFKWEKKSQGSLLRPPVDRSG
ncbi:MAG TPA: metal ABC transporter permease [Nitrososphaerales archaeon]|nr:metal ABC transporter permease [Nitrososphaerales archaeon]